MKKWTCKLVTLVLTAALSLSLAFPVLAYPDTEPPLWQQMGYSSLEELLEEGWLTEEEYAAMAADELAWQQEQQEELLRQETWIKDHPNEVAAFDADAYFQESYAPWMGEDYTPQMYMEEWGMSREEFEAEMLGYWVYDMVLLEEERASMAQEKTELGRVPGGHQPDGGRSLRSLPRCDPGSQSSTAPMVPLAPAMEYLGAQVTYLPGENGVEITLDEVTLRHTIGTSQLTVIDGQEEPRSLNMDAASYAKDGRTMVPVAFFAQVLGYEVFWDADYETAVLLDREALAEKIDQEFTLLNRVLYSLSGEEYRQDGKSAEYGFTARLGVTALDSLNGDKTYSATLEGEALAGGGNANLSLQGDVRQLVQMFRDQNPYVWDLLEGQLLEDDESLSQLDLEGILNGEEQTVFLRGALSVLLGLSQQEDAWVKVDQAQLYLPAGLDHVTVGQIALRDNLWGSPFHYYSQILSYAGEMELVLGDSRFTKTGGAYQVAWDESDLDVYLLGDETFSAAFTITPTGEKGAACTLELQARDRSAAMELSLEGGKAGMELTLDLHFKNTAKAALECRLTIAPSRETRSASPRRGTR